MEEFNDVIISELMAACDLIKSATDTWSCQTKNSSCFFELTQCGDKLIFEYSNHREMWYCGNRITFSLSDPSFPNNLYEYVRKIIDEQL